jgi:hypothetical protein
VRFEPSGDLRPGRVTGFVFAESDEVVGGSSVRVTVSIDIDEKQEKLSRAKLEETQVALRELGLSEAIEIKDGNGGNGR